MAKIGRPSKKDVGQRQVLEALAILPVVKAACRHAGISTKTYYEWINSDDEFRSKCSAALELSGKENMADAVKDYGFGLDEQGDMVVKDSTTARWILERLYPEKYSRTQKMEHSGDVPVTGVNINVRYYGKDD